MADVIVCEVLCYIANNYADATKHGLLTTVSGFYTSEEIVKAKDIIFDVVDQLRGNGTLPLDLKHRNIIRKQGDKKRRQDAEDIVAVYADLDASKVLLPVFTAANLQRIPPFSPDATDYCTLAFSVSQLQTQMAHIQRCLSARPVGTVAQPQVTTEAVSVADKLNMLMAPVDESSLATTSQDGTRGNGSWAQTAAENPELVPRMRPAQVQRSKVQIKVKGTKVSDNGGDKIKAVPRTAVLTAFVGRLDIDTSEEDLTRYLTGEGMKGIVCRKLKAKDGRTFNTAAFRVTCSEDSRDLFYNDNCWPAGAELRDWIFYNN